MIKNMRALKEFREGTAVILGKDVEHLFYDMRRDGVTQSLLSMWLTCRQKARLYLEGWDSKYHKEALIDGNVGHACLERSYNLIREGRMTRPPSDRLSKAIVSRVEAQWYLENAKPSAEAREMVERACAVMEVLLPAYFDYWRKDFTDKRWVSLEEKFELPMAVTSMDNEVCTIPLRGKKDGTFRTPKGVWLFETKFKSQVDEEGIVATLGFETQVMIYMLQTYFSGLDPKDPTKAVPRGCLYNIVRRATLRKRVKETIPDFARRVREDIAKRPEFYFMRMESPLAPQDLHAFQKELQELLGDMWDWWRGLGRHYKNTYACIGKLGKCQYLPVCSRGDYGTLAKRKVVFKELEDY